GARAARTHGGPAGAARRRGLPRRRRIVVHDRRQPRRGRRLVGLVIADAAPNHVDGKDVPAAAGEWLDKRRPADGSLLCRVARSRAADVDAAVAAARRAQPEWAERTVVSRGDLCRELALALRDARDEVS